MRPTVNIAGARGNAYKLLVRVSNAMPGTRWEWKWNRFYEAARGREVVTRPSDETSPELRRHVLATVHEYCDVIEIDMAPTPATGSVKGDTRPAGAGLQDSVPASAVPPCGAPLTDPV